jgi:DNA-binding GntR family transcriptional regulator
MDCRLEPQKKLRLKELTARYGYSAAPLREALSRLVSEKLVVAEEQRGFFVSDVSLNDLIDLTFVRQNIETIALRASIENGDSAWEGNVVGLFHRLSHTPATSGDDPNAHSVEWRDLHKEFHRALVSECGSPRLLAIRDLLFDEADRYRRLSVSRGPDLRDIESEHKAIFDAVIARDADLACQLMGKHIQNTAEHAKLAMNGK